MSHRQALAQIQRQPSHGHYTLQSLIPILLGFQTNCLDYQDRLAPMQGQVEVKRPSGCFSGLVAACLNTVSLPCFSIQVNAVVLKRICIYRVSEAEQFSTFLCW